MKDPMIGVPLSVLQKFYKDLDACQQVMWRRGGFSPDYCENARNSLEQLDDIMTSAKDAGEPPAWEDTKDKLATAILGYAMPGRPGGVSKASILNMLDTLTEPGELLNHLRNGQ